MLHLLYTSDTVTQVWDFLGCICISHSVAPDPSSYACWQVKILYALCGMCFSHELFFIVQIAFSKTIPNANTAKIIISEPRNTRNMLSETNIV